MKRNGNKRLKELSRHAVFLTVTIMLFSPAIQAASLTGTVTGPGGLVENATVSTTSDGETIFEATTDINGEYALVVPDGGYWYIRADPPIGQDELIGEELQNPNFDGDREVNLFLGTRVTLSGTVELPEGFTDPIEIEFRSLDKFRFIFDIVPEQGAFEIDVPAGIYTAAVRHTRIQYDDYTITTELADYYSYVGVDARAGSVQDVLIPAVNQAMNPYPNRPPVASLISVGVADEGGIATVTGAPGATDGKVGISVYNLQTSLVQTTGAGADGSFSLRIFAPPGAWLGVSQDHSGQAITQFGEKLAAATIIRVPPAGDPETAFASMNRVMRVEEVPARKPISVFGAKDSGQLWIGGNVDSRSWAAGETINLSGTAKVYSRNIPDTVIDDVNISGRVFLEMVFDANGKQEHACSEFSSHLMTPTGFPIERRLCNDPILLGDISFDALSVASTHSLGTTWSASFDVLTDVPDGVYQLMFELRGDGLPTEKLHFENVFPLRLDSIYPVGETVQIEIGNISPRRLFWALAMNELSNGSRGVVAEEELEDFGIAGHVSSSSREFIVPREDPRTGISKSYLLEPFSLLTSNSSGKGLTSPPTVPFAYPSGSLNIEITNPDQSTDSFGPVPIVQSFMQEAHSKSARTLAGSSIINGQNYGLTTLDDNFRVIFEQYGRHEILLNGTIDDIWGNTYTGGGTYIINVARTLDLETGVFPSTGFEVGDTFSPTLIIQPGVAADVEIRVRQYPESDPLQMSETIIEGKANRFGYFQPTDHTPLVFTTPGEYRVDYTATYSDENGVVWMGSASWGSVIATPTTDLIAHGRRGLDNDTVPAWFTVRNTPRAGGHMFNPYFGGDIMWMEDLATDVTHTADVPAMSLQDTQSDFADMFLARIFALPTWIGWVHDFENRFIIPGGIPIFSTTAGGLSPALFPTANDSHWAYFYYGAARPGVRIREMVTEHDADNGYWRFDDTYYYQLGVGSNGDKTNDFKFQYGGAVYRAPDLDFYYYGIHGSLFVLVPPDDPVGIRVMPPFQGNAGGPNGGPIMNLLGEDIDMFFHPTGTRPGSILELGNTASFAGAIAPTLPSQVSITITSPSEVVRNINGTANLIGYFYDPDSDFEITEAGRWKVSISVTHNGQTSAGPTQVPYPTGNVLGSVDGEFYFYVVDPLSDAVAVNLPGSTFVKPGEGSINIPLIAPDDLTGTEVQYSVVMPGFIMSEGEQGSFNYVYDAPALATGFPNLDLYDEDGVRGVDTVTLSFLVKGMDSEGQTVYRARQVLLQGEELILSRQRSFNFVFDSGFE